MKRLLSVFLAVMLLAGLAVPAAAAAEATEPEEEIVHSYLHYVEEMKIGLPIPENYDVLTRDMAEDDPVFKKYEFTLEDIQKILEEQSIYLNALEQDTNGGIAGEIVVTMAPNSLNDFKDFSEKELESLTPSLKDEYKRLGMVITDVEIQDDPQLMFVVINFHDTEKTTYGLQYYTVHDKQAMNFTLRSYTGPVSEEKEDMMETIVEGITAADLELPYEDEDAGVTFTVPKGWAHDPELEEGEDEHFAGFCNLEDGMTTIMYTSVDLWDGLEPAEKKQLKRSELNADSISKDYIAEKLGVDPADIKAVKYNGQEYYKVVLEEDIPVSDKETVTLSMPQLLRIDNGWMFLFQLTEIKNSGAMKTFEQLMKTVEYAKVK